MFSANGWDWERTGSDKHTWHLELNGIKEGQKEVQQNELLMRAKEKDELLTAHE